MKRCALLELGQRFWQATAGGAAGLMPLSRGISLSAVANMRATDVR